MNQSVFWRLGIMMFLQFFVWGAWYVSCSGFMAASGMGDSIPWAYSVGPIAAIVSPFFLGMVADRFFASERVLSVLMFLSAISMLGAGLVAATGQNSTLFIVLLLLHMLCFMPTLGLTNTLAFHNLTDQGKQFPLIRVFGTIGWIVANLVISFFVGDKSINQFYVTAGAAVVLAVFSFALPHTPPPAKGQKVSARAILGLDALSLMKKPSFAVFIIASFLTCIPLAAYYAYANVYVGVVGFEKTAATMSLGQAAEVIFMVLMPLFFVRLGVKWMLLVGMAAWVVRYGLFAGAASDHVKWMVVGGILLHGICYDFFFVTGFIYTDKRAPKEIRGQAQGLLVLVTQGLGMIIGAQVVGRIVAAFTPAGFRELKEAAKVLATQAKALTGDAAKAMERQAQDLSLQADRLIDWQWVWLIPCIMAAVIMVAFFLLFKDDSKEQAQQVEADAEAGVSAH